LRIGNEAVTARHLRAGSDDRRARQIERARGKEKEEWMNHTKGVTCVNEKDPQMLHRPPFKFAILLRLIILPLPNISLWKKNSYNNFVAAEVEVEVSSSILTMLASPNVFVVLLFRMYWIWQRRDQRKVRFFDLRNCSQINFATFFFCGMPKRSKNKVESV
jgi:hypothetical protein